MTVETVAKAAEKALLVKQGRLEALPELQYLQQRY
jgi:hypothetical protein